jgi:hypothetical protein
MLSTIGSHHQQQEQEQEQGRKNGNIFHHRVLRKKKYHHPITENNNTNSTLPIEIDFGMYTNDINMGNIVDTTTLMGHVEDNNNDTEMGHGEDNNNALPRTEYVGSAGSFATRDMNSDGTSAVIEEEQSITGHNFNNAIDEVMDYTTTSISISITTTTTTTPLDDGFRTVQNQTSLQERQQARIDNTPYFVLGAGPIKQNSSNNKLSAKTDLYITNEECDDDNDDDDDDVDNDYDNDEDSIPRLQDRDEEDSSDDDDNDDVDGAHDTDDDDDDDDDNVHSSNNGDVPARATENSSTVHYLLFGRDKKEYDDDNSDSDNESYGATGCRQQEYKDDNVLAIPELICRKDNDDSSDDDDDNSIEYSINDCTSSNTESESPIVILKNRYSKAKTFRTRIKINIKKRNGMMSNIANTTVLRLRGGAGDADSIVGTTTGVEDKKK